MTSAEFDACNARVDRWVRVAKACGRGALGCCGAVFLAVCWSAPGWVFSALFAGATGFHAAFCAVSNHIDRMQLAIINQLNADIDEMERQCQERMPG